MEAVLVWSMLVWNASRTPPTDRLSVTTTDNYYQTEDECRIAAHRAISNGPKVRVACVQTILAKSELETMKRLQDVAEKALRDFPDAPKP